MLFVDAGNTRYKDTNDAFKKTRLHLTRGYGILKQTTNTQSSSFVQIGPCKGSAGLLRTLQGLLLLQCRDKCRDDPACGYYSGDPGETYKTCLLFKKTSACADTRIGAPRLTSSCCRAMIACPARMHELQASKYSHFLLLPGLSGVSPPRREWCVCETVWWRCALTRLRHFLWCLAHLPRMFRRQVQRRPNRLPVLDIPLPRTHWHRSRALFLWTTFSRLGFLSCTILGVGTLFTRLFGSQGCQRHAGRNSVPLHVP